MSCIDCKFYDLRSQWCDEREEEMSATDNCADFKAGGRAFMEKHDYTCEVCKNHGGCKTLNGEKYITDSCSEFELSQALLAVKQHEDFLMQQKKETCPFIEHVAQK